MMVFKIVDLRDESRGATEGRFLDVVLDGIGGALVVVDVESRDS